MGILQLFTVFLSVRVSCAVISASLNSVTNLRVGDDIRFPLPQLASEKQEVTFKRRSPVDFKILAWNSETPERPYRIHPRYSQRVQYQPGGFTQIRNVTLSDEGVYELRTDYLGERLRDSHYSVFELRVFEPVSRPMVVVSSNCTMNCSHSGGKQVTCRWRGRTTDGFRNYTFRGAVLQLRNRSQAEFLTYTCIVENPVSWKISQPVTPQLCTVNPARSRNDWMGFLAPAFCLVTLSLVFVLGFRRQRRAIQSDPNSGGVEEIERGGDCRRGERVGHLSVAV
ncbi:SLAM family member 9-like [Mustelus asterias]